MPKIKIEMTSDEGDVLRIELEGDIPKIIDILNSALGTLNAPLKILEYIKKTNTVKEDAAKKIPQQT